jgi:hypothetical protein
MKMLKQSLRYFFMDIKRWYYDHIYPIFCPAHKQIRKAVPRKWIDISQLIVTVNFELIKSFYEKEYSQDIVDWSATDGHQKFADWIEKAYVYITTTRPQLEKDLENAYPPLPPINELFKEEVDAKGQKIFRYISPIKQGTYEEVYGEVNRLEKLIHEKDTEFLTELIKNRDFFWT